MIILVHLTLSSISQTASDSVTCLPNSKLRKAIRQIEDCKILKEELEINQSVISTLQYKVDLKDHIISSYEMKDSLSGITIHNLQTILQIKDREIFNEKKIGTLQSLKIKTLKINKWIYAGAGLLTGVLVSIIGK